MSVYIKGMDKETAVRICAYAGLRVDDSDFVPVPPHGRLIDADTLEADTEWDEYEDGFISYSRLAIDTAATVINKED